MPELHIDLPVIAIVGRPNVGKSTLINRIIGERKAIVDDQPGVTRDRAFYAADWCGRDFMLVDTGGMVPESDEMFDKLIFEQVNIAVGEADLIVFMADGRDGVTEADKEVATHLRKQLKGKPVVMAVNKIDNPAHQPYIHEFHQLGLGEPVAVSAIHGFGGVGNLLDRMIEPFGGVKHPSNINNLELSDNDTLEGELEHDDDVTPLPIPKVALVGRPNVGKSSIFNGLVQRNRSIVSEVSGTTRDAIETHLDDGEYSMIIVDTAGVRKKGKVGYGVEMFSVDRTLKAVSDAQITLLVIDATEGLTDQDKKLVEYSNDKGNGLVILVNKWDLVKNKGPNSTRDFSGDILRDLPHGRFASVLFVSAESQQRIPSILPEVHRVFENMHRRVSTNLVNQILREAISMNPAPPLKNKMPKFLYMTQASLCPPTFVLFMNNAGLLQQSYRRYLEKRLRENIDFSGSPVKLIARSREQKTAKK